MRTVYQFSQTFRMFNSPVASVVVNMNTEEPPRQKMPILVSDMVKQARPSLPLPTMNEKGQLVNCFGQLVNDKGQPVKENGKRIHIRGSRGTKDKRNAGIKRANQQRVMKLQLGGLKYQEGHLQDKGEGTLLEEKAETKKRQRESSEEVDATHHKRARSAPEYSTAKDEYSDIWEAQKSAVQAPQGKEKRKELKIKRLTHNRNTNLSETRDNPQFHNVSNLNWGNNERSADWGNDRQEERMVSSHDSSSSGHRASNHGGYNALPRDRYLPVGQYHISLSLSPSPREARDQNHSVSKSFKPPVGPRTPAFDRHQLQSSTQQFEFGRPDTARAAGFLVPTRKFEARSRGVGHQRTSNTRQRSGKYSAPSRGSNYRGGGTEGERHGDSWRKSGRYTSHKQRSSSGRENGIGREGTSAENNLADPTQQQSVSMQYDGEAEVDGFEIDIYADMEPAKEQTK